MRYRGVIVTPRSARVCRRHCATALLIALAVGACSDSAPTPPPRAAEWPAPLVKIDLNSDGVAPGDVESEGEPEPEDASEDDVESEGEPEKEVSVWGEEFVARVDLPVGALGPRSTTAIDPRVVEGISWTGSAWEMERDWNEDIDGGYLDFGESALDVNGHQVLGFRIEVSVPTGSGHVIDGGGEVGFFEITNPQRRSHNSFIRDVDLAHHYVALGVVGDAIKVAEGHSVHHDAYIEMDVRPGGPDDKHYDGVQVFGSGSAGLERIVINWNDAGTIANTTGAIFTQDEGSLTARDIVVLNPGGTWQPIRLGGTGTHDVDDIQIVGVRRANNNQPESDAPTALVKITNDSDLFTLYNEVPGTSDWLIPGS